MSTSGLLAAITALNAINAAGRAVLELTANAQELRALFAQAAAEGRDISTDEVSALIEKARADLLAHGAEYQAAIAARDND
ncbi:MAG: hypothetical protein CME36_09630 [unclassified Hahellaceae]|nr:hypothetical protein [Hahellaceae bacterium]|tara:strand:+ start:27623 stop:27865 length:243 start_codon:yes stop_codon:yes gene_type:complete